MEYFDIFLSLRFCWIVSIFFLEMRTAQTFSSFIASVFSYEHPAVIPQHVFVPEALITFFDRSNILVEPLTLLITLSTQIFWEKIQMTEEEMHLQ